MAKSRERLFRFAGLDLAALEWLAEEGEGRPLIALHGWLDNAASFIPLAPYLDRYHLLAPDLPGHGRSSHLPASAGYLLAENIRWVTALADAQGWRRFTLLGHSMGAAIAVLTAAALPQRIDALVLLDGLGPLAYTPQQLVERLRQLHGEKGGAKPARPFADIESAVKIRQRLGRFAIGVEAARLICERGMAAGVGGWYWRHDPRLKAPSSHYYDEAQAEAVLAAIECKTLLLSGEAGALAGWQGFARRREAIPALEHHQLPGGHHLHMESPEAVAELINGFLAQAGGGEG